MSSRRHLSGNAGNFSGCFFPAVQSDSESDRKRILTIRCSEFEDFGEWNQSSAERLKNMPRAKRYDFTSNQGGAVYYAVLNRKEVGKIAVLFEPEERILTDMKRYIKR